MRGDESFEAIGETMKRAAAAMRDAEIDFVLAGSLATWARGGPATSHDLDFVIRERDAERAVAVLEAIGMRREDPPEDWLLKAWDDNGVLVDLIFGPAGVDADGAIQRGEVLTVVSMDVPVMSIEDVFVTKVLALTEHSLDYGKLLEMARALREQVDWSAVRDRTADSPFADAYFVLLDKLGIISAADAAGAGTEPRVRVEVEGKESTHGTLRNAR